MTEPTPLLEVNSLHKEFRMHLLDGRLIQPFNQISFDLWPGQFMLIGGKSGAGKTTILKCIYRTYLTSGGYIWFNSSEFGRLNIAAASEKIVLRLREYEIGYCSQFLKVLPRVSALDLAAEPLLRQGRDLAEARSEAGRKAQLAQLLDTAAQRGQVRLAMSPAQAADWILLLLDGAFGRAMVEDRFDLQAYRSLVLGAIAAAVTPLPEPQPERPRPKRPRAA